MSFVEDSIFDVDLYAAYRMASLKAVPAFPGPWELDRERPQ